MLLHPSLRAASVLMHEVTNNSAAKYKCFLWKESVAMESRAGDVAGRQTAVEYISIDVVGFVLYIPIYSTVLLSELNCG
jgi:hypothetical protein